jgi:hypothetical protein
MSEVWQADATGLAIKLDRVIELLEVISKALEQQPARVNTRAPTRRFLTTASADATLGHYW